MSKEDFQTLLGKVKEPVLRDLFLFAALSGLRLSEILNLKWSAVDFEKRQFTVSNSETFTTKTGKRTDGTDARGGATRFCHCEGVTVRRMDLVFCKRGGFRLERNYVSKKFKGYVRDAELSEKLHFH